MAERDPERSLLALALSLPLALLCLRALTTPDPRGFGTHEQLGLPACAMHELLDLPCPLCGATTALSLFAHGAFGESLHTHPFAFLCTLVGLLSALVVLVERTRGRDLAAQPARIPVRKLLFGAVALWLLSWTWTLSRS